MIFFLFTFVFDLTAGYACGGNDSIQLIVTYNGYYTRHRRMEILRTSVQDGWFNPGERKTLFSDFDTVEVPLCFRPQIQSKIADNPNIRGFYADRRIFANVLARKVVQRHTDHLHAPQLMNASHLWDMGLKGQRVKVGVFDTGLGEKHPHFRNLVERTDWTNEGTADDGLGHGTFVCGVMVGDSGDCAGFAPAASLFVYKVFTRKQVSYTSWFLDAFNHAIMRGINVINLSIGGPDFTDRPFMDKVCELTANGIVLISAIGNDGPSFGTLNNPADQMDVIGVGGVNVEGRLARFSSRGMTIWELPGGYGRSKPDVVSYGASVYGSSLDGGCRSLSGTSVASPVVAGAVALMLSGIEDRSLWNPGVVKQALLDGAERLSDTASIFEQGAGRVDLIKSFKFMRKYKPMIMLFPPYLDSSDCPYMWPFCSDPLYAGAIPKIINVTIISGLGVSGKIVRPPVWEPFMDEDGDRLNVHITYNPDIWPWTGYIAIHLSVYPNSSTFHGTASGRIRVQVESENFGERRVGSTCFPLRVRIIPTPPRSQRILWDQYRNLRYPPGYIPRDDLREKQNPLDWNGDHPHTNFRLLYQHLRADGYFLEILGEPVTCVNLSDYSVYLIVDPEEEFFPEEKDAIRTAVNEDGLNLLIFADWYNVNVMEKIKFFDENSKQWWLPETAGANIPAVNELLSSWGIEMGSRVVEGKVTITDLHMTVRSGTVIVKAPETSYLAFAKINDITDEIISGDADSRKEVEAALFVLLRVNTTRGGFVSVFTDSTCLESRVASSETCIPLVDVLVDSAAYGLPVSFCESLVHRGLSNADGPPKRSNEAAHFASLSSVISAFDEKGVPSYHSIPACRKLMPARRKPIFNMSMPVDLRDKSATVYERVVASSSAHGVEAESDVPLVRPVWMDSAGGQPDSHLFRFYYVLTFSTFVLLFIFLYKFCHWRFARYRMFSS